MTEERFTELVSNEFLLQSLRNVLNTEGRDTLEELPDGIHSGLIKPSNRGIFFYLDFTRESNPKNLIDSLMEMVSASQGPGSQCYSFSFKTAAGTHQRRPLPDML